MTPASELLSMDADQQLLTVSNLILDGDTTIDPTDADAPFVSDSDLLDMLLQ